VRRLDPANHNENNSSSDTKGNNEINDLNRFTSSIQSRVSSIVVNESNEINGTNDTSAINESNAISENNDNNVSYVVV
jgi:hypothetical protein